MSDETSASNFNAADLFHTAKGDAGTRRRALAIGLVMILVVLILPMPALAAGHPPGALDHASRS